MFRPGPWLPEINLNVGEDLDSLLSGWVGATTPITILDLSGVPGSILTELVGVLLRILFDSLFWSRNLSEGARERPLLVVLEEAHNYLYRDRESSADVAASAVRRIVKEGRKYGLGAMIVTQRPAEIDPTILSQCSTTFAMRLTNSLDRSHVAAAVTDNLSGLLEMLPGLRTGEAIVIGEAVPLPVRVLIDSLADAQRPDSSDPLVQDDRGPGGWNRAREPGDYRAVTHVWRAQDPRSPDLHVEAAMNRAPVTSSTIASVGYDQASSTLEVEFINGRVYQYFDVPSVVHNALVSADSVGTYFNQEIKGVYRYARV